MRRLLSSVSELSGTAAPSPFVPSLADVNGIGSRRCLSTSHGRTPPPQPTPLPLSFFNYIAWRKKQKRQMWRPALEWTLPCSPVALAEFPLKLLHLSTGCGLLRLSSQLHFLSVSQLVAVRADVCQNSTVRVTFIAFSLSTRLLNTANTNSKTVTTDNN